MPNITTPHPKIFLSHVGVFIRRVLSPLNILLVYQHLNTLLDDGDGGSKPCLQNSICTQTM